MDDVNRPITNPELTAAVERMRRENSRESREAVLDLVITTARFLAPVTITPAPEEQDPGEAALGQGTQIQFQLLTNQEGQPFFPAFTSWEELRKLCGPKTSRPWSSLSTTMPPWWCGTPGPPGLWWTPLGPACPSTGPWWSIWWSGSGR